MVDKRTILALATVLGMSGVACADEAEFTPITCLANVLIPTEKMPQGWTLLDKRQVRDNHDLNLLMTVDVGAKSIGATISERACQPLKVAGESFNVDFFFVKEGKGADFLFGLVKGWANPGIPGDIRWPCLRWNNIIMVVCSSSPDIQAEVGSKYLGNLLEVLDAKAAAFLTGGDKDKALKCYAFLAPALKDLPHAYMIWGGLFLYKAKNFPKAVVCYERAAKESGETAFTLQEQWLIQEGIGLSAGMSKDNKKAESALKKSLALAKTSQDTRLLGSSNFNLACAYAEQEQPAQMYLCLEEALKLDGKYAAQAAEDSSFAKYAQQPRFKALVAKYSTLDTKNDGKASFGPPGP